MNWVVFLIVLWLFLGLDVGLVDALQIGSYNIAPSFAIILLTFVAMFAPHSVVMGWALVIGLLIDLLTGITAADGGTISVCGPHALGCAVGAYAILTLRALMFRRNVLSIAFLSFVAGALVEIVAVSILSGRAAIDPDVVYARPTHALVQGVLSAVFTAILAFPVGWFLFAVRPLFRFRDPSAHFPTAGSARR